MGKCEPLIIHRDGRGTTCGPGVSRGPRGSAPKQPSKQPSRPHRRPLALPPPEIRKGPRPEAAAPGRFLGLGGGLAPGPPSTAIIPSRVLFSFTLKRHSSLSTQRGQSRSHTGRTQCLSQNVLENTPQQPYDFGVIAPGSREKKIQRGRLTEAAPPAHYKATSEALL